MSTDGPTGRLTQSRDYRIFFANTFNFRVSESDAGLTLGLQTVDENNKLVFLQEATAMMTLAGLKVLAVTLDTVIQRHEKEHGKIPLSEGKEAAIRSSVTTQKIAIGVSPSGSLPGKPAG